MKAKFGQSERVLICRSTVRLLATLCLTVGFSGVAHAKSAHDYIQKASAKLKPGVHQGQNASGAACKVEVKLERARPNLRYTVSVDPTIHNEHAPAGATVVVFSSQDSRVLYDDQIERAVNNYGDTYLVLGIEAKSSGKTLIRAYEERGKAVRIGECYIQL